jgi:hypothetical protein
MLHIDLRSVRDVFREAATTVVAAVARWPR